jgi:hypothetical protein
MKDRPFALIGVNVSGCDSKALKGVMTREKLAWRSFADPGRVGQGVIAAKWNVTATPTFYAIDHKGVIRYKWVGSPGGKALDAALEKLIGEAEKDVKKRK